MREILFRAKRVDNGEICVGCNCCGRFYDDKGASLTAKQKEERVENWWKKNEVEE